MHDMKTIRDAAERTLAPLHVHDERAVTQRKFDSYALAAFVRDITDETPLAVEALVREGFTIHKINGHTCYVWRNLQVDLWEDFQQWCLDPRTNSYRYIPHDLWPRTVGDLRRLQYQLQRDEGK